ncbi:MAG: hypothetical protein K0R15_1305 [Clostridiales bacterium]|jgi:hypothetical protein|nr:hypothetical protein [Clostridiales bacterium]
MEKVKYKKIYLVINIPIILMFLILLFTPLFLIDKVQIYYAGIFTRLTIGFWCIFNGIWNGWTNFYSIFKINPKNKIHKWSWYVILVMGIGFLVTACMGYGYNGVENPNRT